jgi:hypothetical protein
MEVAMTAPRGHEPAQPSIPSVGPWFVPGRRRRPWWVGLAAVAVLVAWAAVIVLGVLALGRWLDPHVGDSWPVGAGIAAGILAVSYAPVAVLALARRRKAAVLAGLAAWAALGVLSIPGDKWGKKIGTDFLGLNGQLSNGLWVLFAAEILVPVLVLAAGRRRGRPT